MIDANIRVMALARETGRFLLKRPYSSQRNVPVVKTVYMANEMPDVFLVLMVWIACGRKDTVVKHAAARPTRVMISITVLLFKISQILSKTGNDPYKSMSTNSSCILAPFPVFLSPDTILSFLSRFLKDTFWKTNIQFPMFPNIQNQQDRLAEIFRWISQEPGKMR